MCLSLWRARLNQAGILPSVSRRPKAVHRTGRFLVELTERHAHVVVTDPAGVVCAECGQHPQIRAKLTEWAELLELLERLTREHVQ